VVGTIFHVGFSGSESCFFAGNGSELFCSTRQVSPIFPESASASGVPDFDCGISALELWLDLSSQARFKTILAPPLILPSPISARYRATSGLIRVETGRYFSPGGFGGRPVDAGFFRCRFCAGGIGGSQIKEAPRKGAG